MNSLQNPLNANYPQDVTQKPGENAVFIVYALKDLPDTIDKVKDVCANFSALIRSMRNRYPDMQFSCTIGFGADAWKRFFPEQGNPKELQPFELIKAVLPKMREQKSGYILNVTSIAAARSAVGSGYYASSKAALELLTNGLMKELAPLGIKAMVVQPGAFRTRFYDGESLQGTKAQIGDYEAVVGKSRPGNFENKHQQAGDPDKAGKVIVDVVHNDDLPEILTLGKAAVTAVKSTLEAKIAELDKWAEVSASCDYEEGK